MDSFAEEERAEDPPRDPEMTLAAHPVADHGDRFLLSADETVKGAEEVFGDRLPEGFDLLFAV